MYIVCMFVVFKVYYQSVLINNYVRIVIT